MADRPPKRPATSTGPGLIASDAPKPVPSLSVKPAAKLTVTHKQEDEDGSDGAETMVAKKLCIPLLTV
jgi:hypothetical protein